MVFDVVVAGAGPAGWSVASGLVTKGLSVCMVAPDPTTPFSHTYGLWIDEVGEWSSPEWYTSVWPFVNVHLSATDVRRLCRRYGRLNNEALRAHFMGRARGCKLIYDRVEAVVKEGDQFVAQTANGNSLRALLVVDATGHESQLIAHAPGPEPGWQVAYGWTLEIPSHPWENGEAVLMDFRPPDESKASLVRPSFLYVLPETSTRVFVEETSLIGRPPVSIAELRQRLNNRLQLLGITPGRIIKEERCFIPMGGPPAPPIQSVVAFGGAARMVHPGTGYMLAHVLKIAPRLVEAVYTSCETGECAWDRVRRAWAAVWTTDERRAHNLLRFGAEVLMRMDTPSMCSFFDVFFSLPERHWFEYLSCGATSSDVRNSMWKVFNQANWPLRWRLVRESFGRGGVALRQGLV